MEKKAKTNKDKFEEDLIASVIQDYETRREERRSLEQQWKLNINYLMGNQYSSIDARGEIIDEEKDYYWQSRSVYNHIAPIMDTRLAKLQRVRPHMSVRAQGGEDADLKCAKTATDVLNSTYNRMDMDGIITSVTSWSETTGTGFYKIVWDDTAGKRLGELDGKQVYEGDVKVYCVPPFEIFPDSLFHQEIEDCKSIIHARVMHVDDVYALYGVKVNGEDLDVFSFSPTAKGVDTGTSGSFKGCVTHDCVLVIEKYEKPSTNYPNGRVITVCDGKLLQVGELPYINGVNGKRGFPFAKQVSISQVGAFFGTSVIERIIPLQRSYNAVKNRKNEFLNRLSMGVLTVEDGSVDTDELVEDGISPGKVIVYRQGSQAPRMMSSGGFPQELGYEEDRLNSEFISVSGVSEVSRTSQIPTSLTSGVALQLLIEQDDTRISVSGDNIRRAVREVAKQIVRLFKQFAVKTRIMRVVGENNKAEVFYFCGSDITSDDVVFDTENDLSYTPAQRKSAVYELLNTGLLTDDNGKMNADTKAKILEILGFGNIENVRDLDRLHINKAQNENIEMLNVEVETDEYDDDELHIAEHTRFILEEGGTKVTKEVKERLVKHIKTHKSKLAESSLEKIKRQIEEE